MPRIRTRSRSDRGFRRAGVRHTPEPQVWPEGQFTEEQLEQLQQDPEVVVEILAGEPEAAEGGTDAAPEARTSRGKK